MHAKPRSFSLSLVLLGLAIQFLAPQAVFGQWSESFESRQSVWQIENWDASGLGGRSIRHGQTTDVKQSGDASYRFRYSCGNGSEILASYAIPAARVIRELEPKLSVRCSTPGVQLLARVVLPETPSPSGNGPLTLFLPGDVCKRSMKWTQLGFGPAGSGAMLARLQKRLPVLRQKYGAAVSIRGAYVDLLVLNLYTGPGDHQVWVDSLAVDGLLPYKKVAASYQTVPVAFGQKVLARKSRFSTDGTTILLDGNVFVVRAIEYNGENVSKLKELGFNCLWLKSPPDRQLRTEALNQQVWLICPPPLQLVPGSVDASYDAVMAWRIGSGQQNLSPTWDKQGEVKQRITQVQKNDFRTGRPVLVRPVSGFAAYSRISNIVSVGRQVLGTQFPLSSYGQWLQKRIGQAGSYSPFLADVWLDYPLEVQRQAEVLSGRRLPIPASSSQLRGQVFQAFSAGCRGFLFRSRFPLDRQLPGNKRREMACAWVNRQLLQLQPWVGGSLATGTLPQQQARLKVYSFKTAGSRLLLCNHVYGNESYNSGLRPEGMTIVSVPGAGMSDQAYRLTPTGLVPAVQTRVGADRMIELPESSDWEAIVLTQDPAVTRYVNYESNKSKREWSFHRLFHSMAANSTHHTSRLHGALVRSGQDPLEVRNLLTRALFFRQGMENPAGRDDLMKVWLEGEKVQSKVSLLHQEVMKGPQSLFSQPVASPLVLHPMLVPLHWQSMSRFAGARWSANSLPAGDFENLDLMKKGGWQHVVRRSVPAITDVQLHPGAATDGKFGLRIDSRPKGSLIPTLLEETPIEIRSPEIVVPANHMVEIRGMVRVDRPITGSLEGFQIVDSFGGKSMAHLIHHAGEWKRFVIYRGTLEDRKLQLSFQLNGYGTVLLDEVTIRQTPLTTGSANATTAAGAGLLGGGDR